MLWTSKKRLIGRLTVLHGFSATEEKRDTTASRCIGEWDFGDEANLWWSNDLRSSWRNFDHFFWYKTSWKKQFSGSHSFVDFPKEIVFSPTKKAVPPLLSPLWKVRNRILEPGATHPRGKACHSVLRPFTGPLQILSQDGEPPPLLHLEALLPGNSGVTLGGV